MKGWAILQRAIYEIKQEYDVDNTHIRKLLKKLLAENMFIGNMGRRTHGKNRAANFRS